MTNFYTWPELKTKIFPALVPTAKNNMVAKDWLNLKEVIKFELPNKDSKTVKYIGTISKEKLAYWGIDETTLFAQAEKNLQTINNALYYLDDFVQNGKQTLPFCITNKPECICIPPKNETDADISTCITATWSKQYYGANILLNKEIMHKIYEEIGEIYIIGSSKHEIIIIPANTTPDVKELQMMVQCINKNQDVVDPDDDFLSNDVYYYDGKQFCITT